MIAGDVMPVANATPARSRNVEIERDRPVFEQIAVDFTRVAAIANVLIRRDQVEVIPCVPHRPPKSLPPGKLAVYVFMQGDRCLKVGKAGPKSQARYCGQHYGLCAPSTLAKSLLRAQAEFATQRLDATNVKSWICENTTRWNFLIPLAFGIPTLNLLEAFIQSRLQPAFEGFPSQRKLAERQPDAPGVQKVRPMSYREFTLETVIQYFNITISETTLFPHTQRPTIPAWLPDALARGTRLALLTEKSRSEFIVAPILLAARELSADRVAIFSGQRFDVDPEQGLVGECDFILALGPALPPLHAPIVTVVEAKKNDIEAGIGQCIAQMIAARRFNQSAGKTNHPVFGCVTTGEAWQFLRASDDTVLMDKNRYYLDDVSSILGALEAIYREAMSTVAT